MIDAKLIATSLTADAVEVWGVWIPRKGDNVILPVEVVANYGGDLQVDLFHKDYDEAGDGSSASAGTTFNQTTGRQNITKLGLKEIIRVRLTIRRGGALGQDEVGLLLFRFLQPVWFESVRA